MNWQLYAGIFHGKFSDLEMFDTEFRMKYKNKLQMNANFSFPLNKFFRSM